MARISSFRQLDVWQLAMNVVLSCYALTESFPKHELYALGQQVRRSAVSIPSNVAEGHNRHADRAFLNHVNIALGSQAELETQIEVAVRLGYATTAEVAALVDNLARVGQMLHALQRSLEARQTRHFATLGVLTALLAALLLP